MRRLRGPHLCIAIAAFAPAALPAQDVRVSAGTIEDRRTTGRFFAGLEVELKLTGDDLADAKSARILLKKAVDETGRDLVPENKSDEEFKLFQGSDMKLSLKNPARTASAIREISGNLELYMPGRDPASTVTIDRVTSKMDRAVESPALKAQKISMRVVSPKTHRAAAKKREAELDAEMAKHKDEMKKEAGDEKAAEALMALVKGFSGMMNEVSDNDLILEFTDEQKRILDISVVDAKGDSISSNGSMSSGGIKIINFSQKLPPDAKLKVLLQTKKAIVSAPFSLTNVPLP